MWSERTAPYRRLADVVGSLVDPRVGVVASVEGSRREAGSPEFFHVYAQACDTSALSRQQNFRNTGGAAPTRESATAKAIGEAVERYCSALYDQAELPLAPYDAAPFPCVAPEEFALYTQEQYDDPQFPWVPFLRDTPVRWVAGTDLADGREVHVPAARVYVPYHYLPGSGDSPIDQPISTGLACHLSREEAIAHAICEVVERDAVTITWQAMLAPPQVRLETLSDANYDLVQRFERAGGRVVMFDITLDHGIPSILSILLCREEGAPALVAAGASSLDPDDAARGSLEELAHTRRYAQFIRTHMDPPAPDPPGYESVTDQVAHLRLWADHRVLPLADFLFSSPRRIDFGDVQGYATGNPADDVGVLVERISAVGERTVIVDVTTPDVAELGLTVVRAVVPGFHPLHLGHRLRALGGRRLREVPRTLRQPGITGEPGGNPAPHPYP